MALRYSYDNYMGTQTLDLTNIPKESITVSVSIADETLKKVIDERIAQLKRGLDRAAKGEEWTVAARVSLKLKVLEEVLKEAGL